MGEKNRARAGSRRFFRSNQEAGVDPFASLPTGIKEMGDWQPYQIHGPAKALLLADVHCPYHDDVALRAALWEGLDAGCDTVVLLGDIIDFYSVSRWEKDPEQRDVKAEVAATRQLLGTIRDAFPDARIVFKKGNHDERLERYLSVKAPELLNVPEFQVEHLLQLGDLGIDVVGDARPVRLGKLNALHGHEYTSISSAVNAARGLYLKARGHALCGHVHATSQHSDPDIDGKTTTCFTIGCLCDLRPRYLPFNRWGHGCAIVDVDSKDAFSVSNKRIIDGKCWN